MINERGKLAAGRELAESTNQLNEIESDKKRVTDDFKAKASTAEGANRNRCRTNCRSGYEFRQVECVVVFDDPKPRRKNEAPGLTGLPRIIRFRELGKTRRPFSKSASTRSVNRSGRSNKASCSHGS